MCNKIQEIKRPYHNSVYFSAYNDVLKFCKFDWLGYAFSWRESYLNNNYDFWLNIDDKWRKLLKEISSEEYKNIKFSKKPINEYLNKNKTKILKLKRL